MPTNTINVKLDDSKTPPELDVEDKGGQNEVHKNPQPTTIVWKLTGNLAQGSFASMEGTDPGFKWEQAPPDGIFGKAELKANGNRIEIVDTHSDTNSKGDWIYRLRVIQGNNIYSTTFSIKATSNNPVIINKDP